MTVLQQVPIVAGGFDKPSKLLEIDPAGPFQSSRRVFCGETLLFEDKTRSLSNAPHLQYGHDDRQLRVSPPV